MMVSKGALAVRHRTDAIFAKSTYECIFTVEGMQMYMACNVGAHLAIIGCTFEVVTLEIHNLQVIVIWSYGRMVYVFINLQPTSMHAYETISP